MAVESYLDPYTSLIMKLMSIMNLIKARKRRDMALLACRCNAAPYSQYEMANENLFEQVLVCH